MAAVDERRTISLIVRLWPEPGRSGEPVFWRGQIQEVTSGETSHFQLSPTLIEFLIRIIESQKA